MSFRENVQNTLLTKAFLLLFGVGTSVVYARLLGPHIFGQAILLLVFPPVFIRLLSFGIPQSLTYFVGQNIERKKSYITSAYGYGLIHATLVVLILLALEDFLFVEFYESAVPKDLWRLVILTAPLEVWVFYFRPTLKALNKIKDYNLYLERAPTIFRFVVTLILMFGLELEVEAYIYTDIVAKLFMIITIFVCLVKDDVLGLSLKKTELKEMLHYGLRSYGTIVARSITSRIDHIIMALYLSPQYVGIYSIAQSLSEKLMMPTNAICLPLLPKFSRLNRADAKTFANKILDQLALPNLVVIVGASIATGFLIVLVYGEAYAEAHFPFVLLAMAVPPKSSSLILATFFNGTGRPEIKSLQRLGGLGLRALGLVSLVPVYGMAGCALATLGSELIVFSVNYWYYRKTEKLGSERIFHFRVSAITQELRRLKKFGPETKTPSN